MFLAFVAGLLNVVFQAYHLLLEDARFQIALTPNLFLGMLAVHGSIFQEGFMSQSPANYRLISEVKIRREAFGGILYTYGCADRGAVSFINSPQLIELLIMGQQQFDGDLSAAIESSAYSAGSKQKLYAALNELARRGYVQISQRVQVSE